MSVCTPREKFATFLDVETGGLYPTRHSLLSVGIAIVDLDSWKIIKENEWKIPHNTFHVTQFAMRLNKLRLSSFPTSSPEDVAEEITQFVLGKAIGWSDGLPEYQADECIVKSDDKNKVKAYGQNTRFDTEFIRVWYESLGKKSPFDYHTVDLHTITQFLQDMCILPQEMESGLGHLAVYFGILERAKDIPHTALDDVHITIECYKNLFRLIKDLENKE